MSIQSNPTLGLHVGAVCAMGLITGAAYLAGVRPLMAARVEAWEQERLLNEKRMAVDELRSDLGATKRASCPQRCSSVPNPVSLMPRPPDVTA